MLFNTHNFLLFFVAFYAVYLLLRRSLRCQNLWLLLGSYVFYGWWDIRFLFLIVLSTLLDFACARMIDKGSIPLRERLTLSSLLVAASLGMVGIPWRYLFETHGLSASLLRNLPSSLIAMPRFQFWVLTGTVFAAVIANVIYPWLLRADESTRRKFCLTVSLAGNLTILGFFKYYNFFVDSFAELLSQVTGTELSNTWTLSILLPVGISFYTFQTMRYSIDVYRRQMSSVKRLVDFAVYVAYFPQLVAGPIERASRLLPVIQTQRPPLDMRSLHRGCWLILWGLFKKIVVADNMALFVNQSFAPYDSGDFSSPAAGVTLLLSVYAFAMQIYCDFSGYTAIARGIGELLGIRICRNFDVPYAAVTPSEFWRRWHISLSSWLRDYLYIPLGGNRGSSFVNSRNLMITMLLGGLWHGAAWTFVVWGFFHGVILCLYRFTPLTRISEQQTGFRRLLLMLAFFQVTCLGWLIFRSQNLGTITLFMNAIAVPSVGPESWKWLIYVVKFAWVVVIYDIFCFRLSSDEPLLRFPPFIQLNVWIGLLVAILTLAPKESQDFIYFAF